MSKIPTHFKLALRPSAASQSVVTGPNVRFTVLSSRLIRMEYSSVGEFEDHASQTFWYRDQPVPVFSVNKSVEQIEIQTEDLKLTYQVNPNGFSRNQLRVHVFATGGSWSSGTWNNHANLRGTTRTLDEVDGRTRLDAGLMSRDGWAIVDDSKTLVFNEEGWISHRDHPENPDWYFFGFGHDYTGCLREFCNVAGEVPLVPRWAMGNWWSRFWDYSQQEYLDLMAEFKERDIPLTVCVIDMDWHITQTGNDSSGWTGYTWNRKLFPDPAGFLKALKAQGLKTTLNVHPAEGVHAHEEAYAEMARRVNIDPHSGKPVDFDIPAPEFANAYFEVLHHPQERQGVDFWWIDWQQGDRTKMAGLDPLFWLNHLHFYDLARDGLRRPFIFSRWGGLGSHRYTIGFSGDTITTWASLAFQPYFTATAANVGYSWWSHDIGGHMGGIRDGELYARWVQFGVFSPILRLHATKTLYHDRRPWAFDAEIFKVTQAALQLRYALIPYLYSMAWRNHAKAQPLVQPMYFTHPEVEAAYHVPNQYWYGSELIAAPFTAPRDPDTRLSAQTVWLPEGEWFNFFNGEYLPGDRWHTFYGTLGEIPVIARAGAIVPLARRGSSETTGDGAAGWGDYANPAGLDVHVFPGADHVFDLYEDDGESENYRAGHACHTVLSQQFNSGGFEFRIHPTEGESSLIPGRRTWRVEVHGLALPKTVTLLINDCEQAVDWSYGAETEEFEVEGIVLTPSDQLVLKIEADGEGFLGRRDRRADRVRKLLWNFLTSNVNTCQELDNRLGELLDGTLPLEYFSGGLTGAQLEALRNTIH